MEGKDIYECFADLIQNKAWYLQTTQDRKLASKHKALFLKNKLSENIIREYLRGADYELVQKETWKLKE